MRMASIEAQSRRGEHGLRGGRRPGKKVLTGIAVEISEPKGAGRCRMAVPADASAATLGPFVSGNVEPGTRAITDGRAGWNGLASLGYVHERRTAYPGHRFHSTRAGRSPLRRYPGPDLAGGQRQGDVLLVSLGQERIDAGHGRAGRGQRGYLVVPAAGQAADR